MTPIAYRLRELVQQPIGSAEEEANLCDEAFGLVAAVLLNADQQSANSLTRLIALSGRPDLARRVFNEGPRHYYMGLRPDITSGPESYAKDNPLHTWAILTAKPVMLKVALDLAPNHPQHTGEQSGDTTHGSCLVQVTDSDLQTANIPGTIECARILLDRDYPVRLAGRITTPRFDAPATPPVNARECAFFGFQWPADHAHSIAELARDHHRRQPFDLESRIFDGLPPFENAIALESDAAAALALELGSMPTLTKLDAFELEAPVPARVRSIVAELEMRHSLEGLRQSQAASTTPLAPGQSPRRRITTL